MNDEVRMDRGAHGVEDLPEWGALCRLVGETVAAHAERHPGVITEAVVDAVEGSYELSPREARHRERRRDHAERIRRLSHSVFRILERGGEGEGSPVHSIAAAILRDFVLSPPPGGPLG